MQPQQQTVVTGAAPVYVSQPYQTACVVNSYRRRQSTVIGVLLIIAGCLSIVFNIVDLGVGEAWSSNYYDDYYYDYAYSSYRGYPYELSGYSNGISGYGFWCGVMIIIAGGFAIGAARNKTRCMINTFLVFAIIGAVFAGVQAATASGGANNVFVHYMSDGYDSPEVVAVFSMAVLLAVVGACGFGLCLWGSILCCATGHCCCAPEPVLFTTMPVVGHPQVTIISQQQQQPMQPVAMAQPPAYQYQQPVVYPTPPQYPGYDHK